MTFSPYPTGLLFDLGGRSAEFADLTSVLEGAGISIVAVSDLSSREHDQASIERLCVEYQPSLIILSVDQRFLPDLQTQGGFPTSFSAPIMVVTQNFDAAQIQSLLELGASDFITPPFTAANILPRFWRLLRQSAPISRNLGTLQERMAMDRLGLVGESPVFLDEIKKVGLLARCDITVMIGGETGTGKELIARAIHYLSARSDRPFVPVDCGAIPPELTESELFGHERGAFTGAINRNQGLIASADHGTLFLDEVDALPLSVQAKLLRFLQEMEYRSLGSTEIKKADVRLISATNRDLGQLVSRNEFRKDLYYRLNVVQLNLPSLCQRREDIILLARHFNRKHAKCFGQPQREFSRDAIQKLLTHQWPGNIRELENVIGAAVALCGGPQICARDLLLPGEQSQSPVSFREAKAQVIIEFEREYIMRLLSACDGNVSQAARAAGKNRRAFWELIRKHRIDAQDLRHDRSGELTRKATARPRGFATG